MKNYYELKNLLDMKVCFYDCWLLSNFFAVLPELLEEDQPKQSLLQVLFIIAGIVATAAVTILID